MICQDLELFDSDLEGNTVVRKDYSLLYKGHLIALALLLSWLIPDFRGLWDHFDRLFFQTVNYSLVGRTSWQAVLALLNHRVADLLTAALMGSAVLHYIWDGERKERLARGVHFFSFAIYTLVSLISINFFMRTFLALKRLSPTMTMDYAIRLSESFPTLAIKDASIHSFPGDHTVVLIMWAGFLCFANSRKYILPTFLLTILASFPRLISGAHWLSDDVVGAGVIASVLLSWAYGTPLMVYLTQSIMQTFFKLKPSKSRS